MKQKSPQGRVDQLVTTCEFDIVRNHDSQPCGCLWVDTYKLLNHPCGSYMQYGITMDVCVYIETIDNSME